MKTKTIIFNLIIFSVLLTPIIHAALPSENLQLLLNAAKNGNLEELKKLIESDMDPNTTDNYNSTLLYLASEYGHLDIVKYLLEEKANPNLPNNLGITALIIASALGREDMVKFLLEHDADPDLKDNDGSTALMQASSWGFYEIVKLFLKHGAEVDLQNKDGKTALMMASMSPKRNKNVMKLLLEHNASTDLRDKEGKTALDLAKNYSTWLILSNLIREEKERRKKIGIELAYDPYFIGEEDREKLFDTIYILSLENPIINESNARKIFENAKVQKYMPKWYDPFGLTKIGFMENFVKYCKKKFMNFDQKNRKLGYQYGIITGMATTYLGYLKKPWITKKRLALIATAAALHHLDYDLRILAVFKGLANKALAPVQKMFLQKEY